MFERLYKYYPEMKEVFEQLYKQSPNYYTPENFEIQHQEKKSIICHKYEGIYSKITMEIQGNEIRAKAGASPGKGRYDSQLNDFLNYPMPNKKYIVDNCFVYETDEKGRVVKANADINKADAIQRITDKRFNQYPKWVNEMDGDNGRDDGGHIFAASLKGPAEKINIVPMERNFQRTGDWVQSFEGILRKRINDGHEAKPIVELLYEGSERRPFAFRLQMTPKEKTIYSI